MNSNLEPSAKNLFGTIKLKKISAEKGSLSSIVPKIVVSIILIIISILFWHWHNIVDSKILKMILVIESISMFIGNIAIFPEALIKEFKIRKINKQKNSQN